MRMDRFIAEERLSSLTKRERDVLLLIAEGLTNTKIADKLCVSIRTVEWHRSNLILKLKLETASQLVITAVEYVGSIKGQKISPFKNP